MAEAQRPGVGQTSAPRTDLSRASTGGALRVSPAGSRGLARRFLGNWSGMLGLATLLLFTLLALLAPAIAPHHWAAQSIPERFQTPSAAHLFGTDELGRDILSRVLFGSRYSLIIGGAAVLVSFAVGSLIGTIAGFYRRLDGVVMRLIDILMAFPGILLAIAIVAALGPGLVNVVLAIAINEVPGFARLTRALVLSLREREFVLAARLLGASDAGIIRRHLVLNLISPSIVYASLRFSSAVLIGATLSFLGLGIQPPTPEWGAMVSVARQFIGLAPHTFVFPTLAIFLTVVACNLLGDALRDTLDPTVRE